MTRDYLNMKLLEAKTLTPGFYAYAFVTILANWTINPMIEHFNKRGIFTNYWVINDDDEIHKIMKYTTVQGIMTDRPTTLRKIQEENARKLQAKKEEANIK